MIRIVLNLAAVSPIFPRIELNGRQIGCALNLCYSFRLGKPRTPKPLPLLDGHFKTDRPRDPFQMGLSVRPSHRGPLRRAMLPRHFIAEQPPKRIVGATIAVTAVEQKRQAGANSQAGPMSPIVALIDRFLKRCQGDKD